MDSSRALLLIRRSVDLVVTPEGIRINLNGMWKRARMLGRALAEVECNHPDDMHM